MTEQTTSPGARPFEHDIRQIMDMLPHRYPFLLVDRVLSCTPMESITALKNVSFNEPFFQGHFPGLPVMPGVLIMEALAQAGGLLVVRSSKEPLTDKVFMFTSVSKLKFRRPVVPGDQLILECYNIKHKLQLVKMDCQATVNGDVAVEASMGAAIINRTDL